MTKEKLHDIIQDNWLSWKKKQQIKAAVDEYVAEIITEIPAIIEIVKQEYERLRELKDKYEGTPSGTKWAYRCQAVRDVLKLINERLPIA